jgi:SulP family sulfate permease
MADVVEVNSGLRLVEEDEDEGAASAVDAGQRADLPPGVEVFQIAGPLFFGTSSRLDNLLDQFFHAPRVFILRMRLVPIIDASGVHALRALDQRCRQRGIVLVASGLQPQPRRVLEQMSVLPRDGELYFVEDYEHALALARELVGTSAAEPPTRS